LPVFSFFFSLKKQKDNEISRDFTQAGRWDQPISQPTCDERTNSSIYTMNHSDWDFFN
jgi:hypothetical protein